MKQAIEITELGQRVVPMRNLNRTIVAREATNGSGGGHVPALVNLVGLCLRVVEEEDGVLGREELRCSRPYSLVQKIIHLFHDRRNRDGCFPVHPGKSAPLRPERWAVRVDHGTPSLAHRRPALLDEHPHSQYQSDCGRDAGRRHRLCVYVVKDAEAMPSESRTQLRWAQDDDQGRTRFRPRGRPPTLPYAKVRRCPL